MCLRGIIPPGGTRPPFSPQVNMAHCANFWQGKCKFIANFSATMVTSLPSISLSLSLSVSLSLSHQKYLTHNIGSASALPIISTQISGEATARVFVITVFTL